VAVDLPGLVRRLAGIAARGAPKANVESDLHLHLHLHLLLPRPLLISGGQDLDEIFGSLPQRAANTAAYSVAVRPAQVSRVRSPVRLATSTHEASR
jgi:hypothetical protein